MPLALASCSGPLTGRAVGGVQDDAVRAGRDRLAHQAGRVGRVELLVVDADLPADGLGRLVGRVDRDRRADRRLAGRDDDDLLALDRGPRGRRRRLQRALVQGGQRGRLLVTDAGSDRRLLAGRGGRAGAAGAGRGGIAAGAAARRSHEGQRERGKGGGRQRTPARETGHGSPPGRRSPDWLQPFPPSGLRWNNGSRQDKPPDPSSWGSAINLPRGGRAERWASLYPPWHECSRSVICPPQAPPLGFAR